VTRGIAVFIAVIFAATIFQSEAYATENEVGAAVKADLSKCAIIAPQSATAGADFRIRIVGDRQDEKGQASGETKLVPYSWEITGSPFGYYTSENPFDSPYESIVNLKNAGTYTISAKYKAFTFSEEAGWTEDVSDSEYIKKTTIDVPLTVMFDARDGTVQAPAGQYFLSEKCGLFPAASRTRYRFIGWYRAREGKAADLIRGDDDVALLNSSKVSTATVYAHYQKTIKVTFKANGGKVKTKSKKVTFVTTHKKRTYGKLPKPTRKGYHFAGWHTKKKGGKYVSAYTAVTCAKDVILYAHWIK
jgi:uncharacterized repeat protein (TIGR02543 family)